MGKQKVVIAGIGGVGGYFGGLLAKHYSNSETIEILFLARGNHLDCIKSNGLEVVKGDISFVAHPKLASYNVDDFGIADVVIICTKSYDLESVLHQLKPCINEQTIILPLLNGVNNSTFIQTFFPNNLVLDACVYIVSRQVDNGKIENSGNVEVIFFGHSSSTDKRIKDLETLLIEASIDARYSENIESVVWEKFLFLSPIACCTSFFNKSIGEVLADVESYETLMLLLSELNYLANSKKIRLPENSIDSVISKYRKLPFDITTSMHSDYLNQKKVTELHSLCEYVILEGIKYKQEYPTYSKVFSTLTSTK